MPPFRGFWARKAPLFQPKSLGNYINSHFHVEVADIINTEVLWIGYDILNGMSLFNIIHVLPVKCKIEISAIFLFSGRILYLALMVRYAFPMFATIVTGTVDSSYQLMYANFFLAKTPRTISRDDQHLIIGCLFYLLLSASSEQIIRMASSHER